MAASEASRAADCPGDAQERILREFQRALRPGGLLFLGPTESLRACRGGFEVLDPHWRLFRKPGKEAPTP